jgi:hypothetical protein
MSSASQEDDDEEEEAEEEGDDGGIALTLLCVPECFSPSKNFVLWILLFY